MAFDGKDDFVSLKDLAKDFKGVTALTVGMWLLAGDMRRTNFVLDMRRVGGKEPWVLRLMFSEGELAFNPPGGKVVGPCDMSGGWHHVIGTWANGIARLYLDGKPIAEQGDQKGAITESMIADCPAFIGRQVVGFQGPRPKREPRGFVGAIDEFFILRHALAPAEVKHLYQMGVDGRHLVQAP